jgi:hypothetical protein
MDPKHGRYGRPTRHSLAIFERKIIRKIYDPCKYINTREWRIRKNRELKVFIKTQVLCKTSP